MFCVALYWLATRFHLPSTTWLFSEYGDAPQSCPSFFTAALCVDRAPLVPRGPEVPGAGTSLKRRLFEEDAEQRERERRKERRKEREGEHFFISARIWRCYVYWSLFSLLAQAMHTSTVLPPFIDPCNCPPRRSPSLRLAECLKHKVSVIYPLYVPL